MNTKNIFRYLALLITFLAASSTVFSQTPLTASNITVNIDYKAGTLSVTWPDDNGSADLCREYSEGEKISYRIGGASPVELFNNATGTSYSANSATFNTTRNDAEYKKLPAEFFENPVTIIFEARYGNNRSGCPTKTLLPSIPINITPGTRLDDPQSPTAGYDASCSNVPLTWLAPAIVAGATNLGFDVKRRPAGSTGNYNSIASNTKLTSINDGGAAAIAAIAGIEQEYLVLELQ